MDKEESYNGRVRTLVKILLLTAATFLLFGCLGATTRITIKEDGSGTLEITYRVSKLVAFVGAESEEEKHMILPVREADLLTIVDNLDDVSLTRHSYKDDETDILVSATFDFNTIEGLEALFARIEGPDLTVTRDDEGKSLFKCTVYQGLEASPDTNVEQMVTSFFSEYELVWELTAPSTIESVSDGNSSGNGATVAFNTAELLLSESAVVWEARW